MSADYQRYPLKNESNNSHDYCKIRNLTKKILHDMIIDIHFSTRPAKHHQRTYEMLQF